MPSKLGGHFMSGGNPTSWVSSGAKVFKFTPDVLGASSQVPSGPLVIGKLDQQDNALNLTDWKALMNRGFTPEAAADLRFNAQTNIYVGANKPRLNRYAANPRVDIWEDDNEVVPDNQGEAVWYSDYCIEMMGWYESIGKKRANFSFAVGTPDMSIWLHLLPAVRYARDRGHYLALHEYMGYEPDYGVGWKQVDANRQPTSNVWHGRPDKIYPWGWAALRYRYIYDTVFRPAGLGDVRLLITELGCDSVESVTPLGKPVSTWKAHSPYWAAEGKDPEVHYAGMLVWYDNRIREDSYVSGATIFTIGHIGIWSRWDIIGQVETEILNHIIRIKDIDDPVDDFPEEPEEPDMTNDLGNPSFEEGWTNATTFPGQHPNNWTVEWNAGTNPVVPTQPYLIGEARHLSKNELPPSEWDLFILDGAWTFKIFGAGTKPIWPRMTQLLNLSAGRYKLITPCVVDCYRGKADGKDFNLEPNHVQTMVKVNGRVIRDWTNLRAGTTERTETIIDHAGGAFDLAVHYRCNWGVSNNLFIDDWSLVAVPVDEPDEPEPKYKAIVLRYPQEDLSDAQWKRITDYGRSRKRSFTGAHNDAESIVTSPQANADSYIELAFPDYPSQIEAAAYYAARGIKVVPLFDDEVTPPFS